MRDKREVINVKRILSLVLSLCLVMTMMPAAYAGGTAYGAEKLEGAACGSTEDCTGVYDNGFCTACGGHQPAVLNEASFYEISNAGQLYWFAEFVNGDTINRMANAWLTKDIVINENVLNGDGTLASNGASLHKWTPMGTLEYPFRGQFRGNGFSISGIYCVQPEEGGDAGLFAFTQEARIENLAILDSWFAASGEKGIAGSIAADSAGTDIYECYSEASVTAEYEAGGIVGSSCDDYLLQCGNGGNVTAPYRDSKLGGILGGTWALYGKNPTSVVSGCYNMGTVVNTYPGEDIIYYTGALVGFPGYLSIYNSYYAPSEWEAVGSSIHATTGIDTGYCFVDEESVLCKETSSFSDGEVCGLIETHTNIWSYTAGTHTAACRLCGVKEQEGAHKLHDTCDYGGDCTVCGYTIQPGMHAYDDNTCMICGNVCTAHIFGADNNCTICGHQLVPAADIQFERHSASQDAVQGEKLNLTEGVTVLPENADYKNITWYTVVDGVETSIPANAYDTFSVATAGTLTLRGKIENGTGMGTAYEKDFTFTVEAVPYEYNILESSVTIEKADGSNIKITHNGASVEVSSDKAVRVYGNGAADTANCINIKEGASVNLLLDSCTITGESKNSPVAIASGASASITLIGSNQLTGGESAPGIYVPKGASITIGGIGSLQVCGSTKGGTAIGGGMFTIKEPGNGNITIDSGTIVAESYGNSAAIGASVRGDMENITINGGSVMAINHTSDSSGAAGIGAAGGFATVDDGQSISGSITINGGRIEAVGGPNSAGIGSRHSQKAPNIIINGGTIRAAGQATYDIGPGWTGEAGTVTITGGNVYTEDFGIGGTVTSGSEALSLHTITLKGVKDAAIDSLITGLNTGESAIEYGLTDVLPMNNTLYFYLPSGSQPSCVVSDGVNYIGTLNENNAGTFICEHTCVATLTAATCQTKAVCDVCGQDVGELNPDNHESTAYIYEADEKVPAVLHAVKYACCGAVKETARHTMENGICTACQHKEQPQSENGVYLISNAGQLLWFNEHLEADPENLSSNAKLTADIDMTGEVWITPAVTKSYFTSAEYEQGLGYQGTFDGNGHVISNITIKKNDTGVNDALGLFGTLSGTVTHLGMENVTIDYSNTSNAYMGTIASQIIAGGKVSNCFVKSVKYYTLSASSGTLVIGGISSHNLSGTIENCYTAELKAYGITQRNQAKDNTDNNTGKGTVNNCYTDSSSIIHSSYEGTVSNSVSNISAETFASGEIAYKLNGSKSTGDLVWYQTLTGDGKQAYPQFHGPVVFHDSTNESYCNHIHDWTYTKSANTITATCSAEGCFNENGDGGSISIAAPADTTYTGSAIEAVVTNNLKTGDTITVVYSGELTDGYPVNAGTYTASITLDGKTISADYTINPASIAGAAVTAAPSEMTYNGQVQKPDVTVTLDDKILTSDNYTVSYSDNTNAGTAKAAVTGKGNYTGTAAVEFTIAKAVPAASDFTFAAPADLTFNGSAKSVSLTPVPSISDMGSVTVKYYQGDVEAAPVNAGTYTVKIEVAEGKNYAAASGLTDAAWTFTIAKAEASYKAPAAQKYLKYNGAAQALVTAGSTNHGTMMYKLNNGQWSSEVPSAVNAGEYTVSYYVAGDENHKNSAEGSVTVSIDKATPVLGVVSGTIEANETSAAKVTLTRTDESIAGSLTVENTEAVLAWGENTVAYTFTPADTDNYEIVKDTVKVVVTDTAAPDGEVKLETNNWKELVNNVTFGLFFNKNVELEVSAEDLLSGVKTIEYLAASDAMTEDAVKAAEGWQAVGADSKIGVTAADAAQYIYYIRITDKAGNMAYLSTNGMVFDLAAPVITGVTDGATYYTTQKVQISDANLADGIETEQTLAGNVDTTYEVEAADKAGNTAKVTITMKPISDLTQDIADLNSDNVTGDSSDELAAVEETLKAVDTANATEAEKQALEDAKANVDHLQKVIEDAKEAVDNLDEAVTKVDPETITSDDKTSVEELIEDLKEQLNHPNLTEAQKEQVQEAIDKAEDILDKIAADQKALTDALTDVEDITDGDVTADDSADLAAAKDKLEELKADDNYTEDEKEEIQKEIDRIEALEDVISQEAEEVASLKKEAADLNPDTITSDDKEAVEELISEIDAKKSDANLTEEQKAELDEAVEDAQEILDKIAADQQALTDALEAVKDITEEDLKASNLVVKEHKTKLEEAKKTLETLLNDENYTAEEKAAMQEELDRIQELIKTAEKQINYNNIPEVQKPEVETAEGAEVELSSNGSKAEITVKEGYELEDVLVNGESQGKITTLTGLKTGDKVQVLVKKMKSAEEILMDELDNIQLTARSKSTKLNGKKAIKIWWYEADSDDIEFFDGYQVFRSTKRYSGFGKKPFFTTEKTSYTNNKDLKSGNTYYYKVRGYVELDGKRYYSDWSRKAWRKF